MFEVAIELMVSLVKLMPAYFGLYVLFDFIGMLLFDRR